MSLNKELKEKEDNFYYFKIHKKDIVLYHNYISYLKKKLASNKSDSRIFNNLVNLLTPKDIEADEQRERLINEQVIKIVRYFKTDKTYYFKPDKEKNVSFESMIYEIVSTLSFFYEIKIIEDDRDEYIRQAYEMILSYTERNKIERREEFNYGYKAIACYIAVVFGFNITGKINNSNLFQKTRNAFAPKKSDKKQIKKSS